MISVPRVIPLLLVCWMRQGAILRALMCCMGVTGDLIRHIPLAALPKMLTQVMEQNTVFHIQPGGFGGNRQSG